MLGCLVGGENNCTPKFSKICVSAYVYWVDSCGNTGELAETCSCGCKDNMVCKTNCGNCTPHHHSVCTNNFETWYDSCNAKEDEKNCDCGCAADGKVCQPCGGEEAREQEESTDHEDAGSDDGGGGADESASCNPPCQSANPDCCSGECTNVKYDPNNCGYCGNKCPSMDPICGPPCHH